MLRALRIPVGWTALLKRTYEEVMADNCFGLAAQLAYYFFLALFPALLFVVAILSYVPVQGLMEAINSSLSRVAPTDVFNIIRDQMSKIAENKNGGLLTIGMIGTLWSTSSGVSAIIDTLNQAYDVQESRPLWKTKLIAVGLAVALAVFVVLSFALVLVGPTVAEKIAGHVGLGAAFTWTWKILQWPVVFALVSLGVAMIYYFAPDVEQQFVWITPGSVFATILWVLISLGFKFYVANFGSYNATYGTIGGIIVTLTWFYVSALAILVGAELNAEIEHASPYGKDPGEKEIGEKKKIGVLAEEDYEAKKAAGTLKPAIASENCDVDNDLLRARPVVARARFSDWVVATVALGEAAAIVYAKLRSRTKTES